MNRGLLPQFFVKCLIALTVFALVFQPVTADAANKKKKKGHRPALAVAPINQKNPKYSSIVIDAESGTILSQESADALRHPASLTKMMTLLMVFEAIDSGRLQPNQRISVSSRAASMPASKLGLKAGSSIRLDDAVSSLATLSANDMAVALGEAIAGSESAFAKQMTAKAQAIGMSRTRFYNASGLPNEYQVTTARDMARLARYLLARHPNDSRVFAKQRFAYNGRTYNNHNRLMETYAGMDCCKTGFINASGFNLVASAKRDGKRVIGVVFGGRTTVTRNVQMASLLDSGFEKVKQVQPQIAAAKLQRPEQISPAAAPTSLTPMPLENDDVVLASAAANTAIAQEAYNDARVPVQNSRPLQIRQITPANQPERIPLPEAAPKSLGIVKMGSNNTPALPVQASPASYAPLPSPSLLDTNTGWSIQIGAYQTRLATDQAIYKAQQKLPAHLRNSQSVVVPLRTADASWMFRARLSGFTRIQAEEACRYFKDCLTISPQAY